MEKKFCPDCHQEMALTGAMWFHNAAVMRTLCRSPKIGIPANPAEILAYKQIVSEQIVTRAVAVGQKPRFNVWDED